MRYLLVLFACLGSLCCGASLQPLPVQRGEALAPFLSDVTIALVSLDKDNDMTPRCSGVWISDTDILTAAHCARAMAAIEAGTDPDEDPPDPMGTGAKYTIYRSVQKTGVWYDPEATWEATVVKIDVPHDLALYHAADPPPHAVALLAGSLPNVGRTLFIVGHPGGVYWTQIQGVAAGYLTRIKSLGLTGPWGQIAAPVWHGDSGGGVFDDQGNLVGICSFIGAAPGIGYFVVRGTISEFLKAAPDASK